MEAEEDNEEPGCRKSVKVGLRREDVLSRSKWSVDVNQIAAGLRLIWPPSLLGDTTRF